MSRLLRGKRPVQLRIEDVPALVQQASIVSGVLRVVVDNPDGMEATGIVVTLFGHEESAVITQEITFHGNHESVKQDIVLWRGLRLSAGEHSFSFTFRRLPEFLPSDYYTNCGIITYGVSATVRCPNNVTYCDNRPFALLPPSREQVIRVLGDVQKEHHKSVSSGCCGFGSGTVQARLKLVSESSVLVPGMPLHLHLSIDNQSPSSLTFCRAKLGVALFFTVESMGKTLRNFREVHTEYVSKGFPVRPSCCGEIDIDLSAVVTNRHLSVLGTAVSLEYSVHVEIPLGMCNTVRLELPVAFASDGTDPASRLNNLFSQLRQGAPAARS